MLKKLIGLTAATVLVFGVGASSAQAYDGTIVVTHIRQDGTGRLSGAIEQPGFGGNEGGGGGAGADAFANPCNGPFPPAPCANAVGATTPAKPRTPQARPRQRQQTNSNLQCEIGVSGSAATGALAGAGAGSVVPLVGTGGGAVVGGIAGGAVGYATFCY
jgi:hypothetical protein